MSNWADPLSTIAAAIIGGVAAIVAAYISIRKPNGPNKEANTKQPNGQKINTHIAGPLPAPEPPMATNNWQTLPSCGYMIKKHVTADTIPLMVGEVFVRLWAVAAEEAASSFITQIVVVFQYELLKNGVDFNFHSTNHRFIAALTKIFGSGKIESFIEQVDQKGWVINKNFVFSNTFAIEITFDPHSKTVQINNAPVYAGENTKGADIIQETFVIGKEAAEELGNNASRGLALLGRVATCHEIFGKAAIQLDLADRTILPQNLIRLLKYIADHKMAVFSRFRISPDNPEQWDYLYDSAAG